MIKMDLKQLAKATGGQLHGDNVIFSGCSTDTRSISAGELFIALKGERFDGHEFLSQAIENGAIAGLVETSHAQEFPLVEVENTRIAMGELARSWRDILNIPVVAITGSNGKTTVKEMVNAILSVNADVLATRGNLNNDIGVPLTLFRLAEAHQYAVIEMGANHLGEIAGLTAMAKPSVAVITQCAPAHLEGFGSIEGVAQAKGEIFQGLQDDGVAVINADDNYADYWTGLNENRKKMFFGFSERADVTAILDKDHNSLANQFTLTHSEESIRVHLTVPGRHNIMNALAAASCAIALNIPLEQIRDGLENMHGVAGRLQIKQAKNNITIIDDTYNANPVSLEAALKVLTESQGEKWLALGDMGELGAEAETMHAEMGRKAREMGVNRLLGLGPLSSVAVESFGSGANHFDDHSSLIEKIAKTAPPDTALLVKGSRSMQMEKIVNALCQQESEKC